MHEMPHWKPEIHENQMRLIGEYSVASESYVLT